MTIWCLAFDSDIEQLVLCLRVVDSAPFRRVQLVPYLIFLAPGEEISTTRPYATYSARVSQRCERVLLLALFDIYDCHC